MNYQVVNIGDKTVVGIVKKTTNQNMQSVSDIGALWQEFLGSACNQIKNRIDDKAIGLYTDYEGDFTMPYNFIACYEVGDIEDVSEPLVARKIPAGKYAKFTTRGHYQKAVGELWQHIWQLKLDRKYSYDFEIYHNNSDDMNEQQIDIYISLRE